MSKRRPKKSTRTLTKVERERMRVIRDQIEAEKPEVVALARELKRAHQTAVAQLQGVSLSDYRAAVTRMMENALLRPSMYYTEFSDLELIFHGHWAAYCELARFDDSGNSFNRSFIRWLWDQKRQDACHHGWADAISRYAAKRRTDPEKLFQKWVKEFLATWGASPQVNDK
jgi:hypothetical protein